MELPNITMYISLEEPDCFIEIVKNMVDKQWPKKPLWPTWFPIKKTKTTWAGPVCYEKKCPETAPKLISFTTQIPFHHPHFLQNPIQMNN